MGYANFNDISLMATMKGYITPMFFSILFVCGWALIFIKTIQGSLANSGRGGGWGGGCCRIFLMVLCFAQSFIGWCDSFTPMQQDTIPLMVFPMIGFIAFQSNSSCWLVGYARQKKTLSRKSDCCLGRVSCLPPLTSTHTRRRPRVSSLI